MPGAPNEKAPPLAAGPCPGLDELDGEQALSRRRSGNYRGVVVLRDRFLGRSNAPPGVVTATGLVLPEVVSRGVAELALFAAALAPAAAGCPVRSLDEPVV